MSATRYDIVTVGRSSIDFYSNDIGARFADISNFAAFVGGCPTNIAVGTRRLGLHSALVSAVGSDPVGEFVMQFLRKEGVETAFIAEKPNCRTSAVVLGIEPPDKFPLVFYRDNCADINLNIDDVAKLPWQDIRSILLTGTAFSRDPSRSAATYALEQAKAHGLIVFFDLDFRADQWTNAPAADVRAFGATIRPLLRYADIVFGTEEEIKAAVLVDAAQVKIKDSQVSAPEISGDASHGVRQLLQLGPQAVVMKRGAAGAAVHLPDGKVVEAAPFKVQVCNVLGAGDAFASGFIYGYLHGWEWQKCARMGNATGAIVVTRHGCANFMPSEQEALEFVERNGGFKPAEELTCRP
jgi:5-dehydro-2-deoxygluconokinase